MRAMSKGKDGKWSIEKPGDIWIWLHQNDGLDAVVVDDETSTYYCGTEAMRADYQNRGKKAAMFVDLTQVVFEAGPHSEPETSKLWCGRHKLLCSETATCNEDCGYVPTLGAE